MGFLVPSRQSLQQCQALGTGICSCLGLIQDRILGCARFKGLAGVWLLRTPVSIV